MTYWQPMEAAPKDGRWLLAYRAPAECGSWNTLVAVVWNDEAQDFIWPDRWGVVDVFTAVSPEDKWITEGDYYEARGTFTHWIALPQPPGVGAGGEVAAGSK